MKHAIKIISKRSLTFLILLSLVLAIPQQVIAAPGDETTSGQLSLDSTIENISVIFSFSGDNNGNNQAYLYYKMTGAGAWKAGIPMTADRRPQLVLMGQGTEPNPYQNQWRAVIFGLAPNISYDVKVEYIDSDGGSGTVQSTMFTRNDNPPSIGNTYYVSKSGNDSSGDGSQGNPWLTVQKAADSVSPGDTVRIMPGTYEEQVWLTQSGTLNNYITFTSDNPGNMAIIQTDQRYGVFNVDNVSYIRFNTLDLRCHSNNRGANIHIVENSIGNIIENCRLSSVGDYWWAGGVILTGQGEPIGPSYTLIQNNDISTTAEGYDGPFGVLLNSTSGGNVIRNNTFTGHYYDAIGGGPNFGVRGGPYFNTYIYNNIINGSNDDGIEAEGGGINCAIWNNTITDVNKMGIATAPVIVGPMYVFRNAVHGDVQGEATVKLGSSSYGYQYYYHNTFYQIGNSGFATYGSDGIIGNAVFRNNILESVGGSEYVIEEGYGSLGLMDFDYNSLYSSRDTCVKWMNTQMTWDDWRANFGQEAHGIFGPENFVNAAAGNLHLQGDSAGIDKGVILPGFNDPNSLWPYSGGGPDMGAYEYAGGPISDSTPPYTTGHSPAKGSTSVPPGINIVVHVRDNGAGVDQASIVMRVEGAVVTPSITGSIYDYSLTYNPPSDFGYLQIVDVTVNAQDLAAVPNVMSQDSYSFTIQDESSGSNNAPIASAGADQDLSTISIVILDGSGSYDPDGDPITYSWTQMGGPSVSLSSSTASQPTFTPPADGIYGFSLYISDGMLTSTADTVLISVDTSLEGGGFPGGGDGDGETVPGDDTVITSVFNYVTSGGKFNSQVIAHSSDNNVDLLIPKDTVGTNVMGLKLMNIGITRLSENMPSPPDDAVIIGFVYDITPDGASFTPTISLSIKYIDSQIPEGVATKNLVIANFDWTTGQWQNLPSTNHGTSNTVTADLEHFSTYAILAYTRPASFDVTQISTSSDIIAVGSSMDIQALVVNNGDLTGSYQVNCLVDDVTLDTQLVTLDGGDSILVTFSAVPEITGVHTVTVGLAETTFTATEASIPATFTTSSISISPTEIFLGESVEISTLVTNSGDLSGEYEAILKMNNQYVDSKTVGIAGGDAEIILFKLEPKTIGEHSINIGDKIVFFEVKSTADVDIEVIQAPDPEIDRFDITPTYDTQTGKIESTRIDYQIENAEELGPDAILTLKVFHNGEVWEEIPLITLNDLEDATGSISYKPGPGWEVGTYIFEAELKEQSGVVHSIQFEKFTLIEESITRAVSWGSLGIIIGGTLIVLLTVLAIVIYRRREMLRGYVE